jgi:hypothetical protein
VGKRMWMALRGADVADEAEWWRRACALTQIIHLELRHDVLPCILASSTSFRPFLAPCSACLRLVIYQT